MFMSVDMAFCPPYALTLIKAFELPGPLSPLPNERRDPIVLKVMGGGPNTPKFFGGATGASKFSFPLSPVMPGISIVASLYCTFEFGFVGGLIIVVMSCNNTSFISHCVLKTSCTIALCHNTWDATSSTYDSSSAIFVGFLLLH